jgi:hypothetical protein
MHENGEDPQQLPCVRSLYIYIFKCIFVILGTLHFFGNLGSNSKRHTHVLLIIMWLLKSSFDQNLITIN